MNHISFHAYWLRAAACALALAATIGAPRVSAQRFQDVSGLGSVIENGFHGVKQCASGGYIAVGESYCCGSLHACYVVRVDAAGVLVWSNMYKFGGIDRATDVIELASGDFVICGTSSGNGGGGCNQSADVLIMRINSAGTLLAVQRYGSPNSDEEAWKIVEATVGNGTNTFPGDFIVSGSTTNGQTAPNRDGYILRVKPSLGLIWDMQYGGPTSFTDDYFNGIDEVPSPIGGAGDVVATGGTNTWGAGGLDVFTVRIDGNTGAVLKAAASGTAGDDEGQSIIVLRNGPNTGNLVVVGYSNMPAPPSGNDEVLMLQLNPNPCIQVADLAYGDFGTTKDRGFDLKEDANPSPAGANEVIVTGFTNLGGLGQENAFLQRVNTGCGMFLAGSGMAYGGNGNDEGRSLDNATHNNPNVPETPGYIINGFTQSPNLIGADPGQLYQIKTDVALSSGCNEAPIAFSSATGFTTTTCVVPTVGTIAQTCTPGNSVGPFPFTTQLCYANPRAHQGGGNGNDGAAGAARHEVITFNEEDGVVTSFPNPLQSGSLLELHLKLTSATSAHVSVSDIVGHSIYDSDVDIVGGNTIHALSTDGWAAGTYVVRVVYGKKSATTRLIVVDK